jgi:hypothetical protein
MRSLFKLLALSVLFYANNALAGSINDIPSCYAANKLKLAPPLANSELFILIDQTTPLDTALQDSVREIAGKLVKQGNSFVIASFSSFGQGRYMQIESAGAIEATIPEKDRPDISVKLLRNFDACMKGQLDYGRNIAAGAINKALGGSSPDLAKSDIMGSLKELSSRVKSSSARDKIVLVVSDMLENSGITTFYANKNVRVVDPAAELKKAEAAQMIGDFGGARVFVLGAGLLQENVGGKNRDSGAYRDPKTMAVLRQFWEQYFSASNALVVGFGTPALLVPVAAGVMPTSTAPSKPSALLTQVSICGANAVLMSAYHKQSNQAKEADEMARAAIAYGKTTIDIGAREGLPREIVVALNKASNTAVGNEFKENSAKFLKEIGSKNSACLETIRSNPSVSESFGRHYRESN